MKEKSVTHIFIHFHREKGLLSTKACIMASLLKSTNKSRHRFHECVSAIGCLYVYH